MFLFLLNKSNQIKEVTTLSLVSIMICQWELMVLLTGDRTVLYIVYRVGITALNVTTAQYHQEANGYYYLIIHLCLKI